MTPDWETLLPILVHIQANLEGDLGLQSLAAKAGLSPFYFQRIFKAAVGETPKSYTLRLRLDRAAFRLLLHEGTLLELALECGFQHHESFTRAFRRRFSAAPAEYRDSVRQHLAARVAHGAGPIDNPAQRFEISPTRVVQLRPVRVAFIRHVGPYEDVPESIFTELEHWAARRKLPGPPVWMGIGHDSPSTTPPAQLRFDAALQVPESFATSGRIGCQLLPGGPFALTTHAGPYDTLPAAYATIFPRLFSLPGHRLIGLPAIEIYHTAKVNLQLELNHTGIYLPVERQTAVR